MKVKIEYKVFRFQRWWSGKKEMNISVLTLSNPDICKNWIRRTLQEEMIGNIKDITYNILGTIY